MEVLPRSATRSLLIGVGMLMVGSGMLGPLLGLEAVAAGFNTIATGMILAAYYAGFVLGSTVVPGQIGRVGHIRVFAALGSLASAAALVHALASEPVTWMVARLLTGTSLAGLFVIAESWLQGLVSDEDRGTIMSRYMFVLYGGLALGQAMLLIDLPTVRLIIIASVLVSVAVVPVSLTRTVPPWSADAERVSLQALLAQVPLAAAATGVSGLLAGGMLGYTAVYGAQVGLSTPRISLLLTTVVITTAALQPPLGVLSDRVDRRTVLALTAIVAGLAAVVAGLLGREPAFLPLVVCAAIVGGGGMTLYGMAAAHAGDYLPAQQMTGAGARLVLVNGIGAMLGPLLSSVLTRIFGPPAFFFLMAAAALPVGSYALYRTRLRARAESPAAFVPVASTLVTPVAGSESAEELVAMDREP